MIYCQLFLTFFKIGMISFGGVFGVPVTRGIALRLPWLKQSDGAARAVQAARLPMQPGADATLAFTRD